MTRNHSTAHERQPFVLCADDFAMTEGVSRAILTLLAAERLSATCAMTNRPHWPRLAHELRGFLGQADLGLHLNLTCGAPCAPMPSVAPAGELPKLAGLGRMAASSAAARVEIAAEIDRQLDAFEQAMGCPPDFVDGHQHVHVLPGVRQALLAALHRRYGKTEQRPYVRVPSDRLSAIRARRLFSTKAIVVRTLASGFARMAHARGLATNDGFAGFSDFSPQGDYGRAFETYLIKPGPRHLVMCHPGHVDNELRHLDPVLDAREHELAFLMSTKFADTLANKHMQLSRFCEISTQ